MITLATVALAGLLGWAMWGVYMGAPWTRDATVRAYVITMAPEVAGRIVELHVVDNKYVHRGDLLMVIDPTNYSISVSQAEAAVQQAQASVQNIDAQITVQQAQINANQAQLDQAQAVLCSQDSRPRAIRPSRKMATAAFRMPSSSRPSCISRRPRCRLHDRTSCWRSAKSNR
jgi:multidrug resistance efflux pump